MFFAQVFVGAMEVTRGFPLYLTIMHALTVIALWIGLLGLVLVSGFKARELVSFPPLDIKQRARDFLTLTKPIVVLLLLVTTYAGMVVGGKAWPSLSLTFWTLLGGFMAAGGSSAINQYIDRDLDKNMQRTQKRPLAAGRMTPAEGLAFGLALSVLSFYVYAGFVNLLAAFLSLAGIIYYVVLYSILLKKATVQNIVIGGGAGAIPPLVGWAAATGSLNIPALFLFAIIFMWTPPHFWALAIVRKKDYARAGVPMMPVVRGEKETRWKILIYTLELVAVTLLMSVFNFTGTIYLVSALALGSWLIHTAWQVWRMEGNKIAWKMYRYSSMYLAFIFLALMLDAIV
jgi:protoheme IX farnesyltransferase